MVETRESVLLGARYLRIRESSVKVALTPFAAHPGPQTLQVLVQVRLRLECLRVLSKRQKPSQGRWGQWADCLRNLNQP
jgi:hypothetical protein